MPALPSSNDGKLIRVRVAARLEQHVGGLELGLHGSRTRVDVLLHGRDDAGLRDNDGLQGAGVLATHTVCEQRAGGVNEGRHRLRSTHTHVP